MPVYDVHGVPVDFPFEAYPCQLEYMRAVVTALDGGSNALLESPTGTGKTLCLLCSTVAWLLHRGGGQGPNPSRPPRVLYTSRTHSQLKQVIREFRRTSYAALRLGGEEEDAPQAAAVSATALASRDQLCVHREAASTSGSQRNSVCAALRRNGGAGGAGAAHSRTGCYYFNGVEGFVSRGGITSISAPEATEAAADTFTEEGVGALAGSVVSYKVVSDRGRRRGPPPGAAVLDIEELHDAGKRHGFCPYYFARHAAREAMLVFAPYHYVVSEQTRRALGVEVAGSIVIVDEGHNLAQVCADSSSRELTSRDLGRARHEVRNALRLEQELRAGEEQKGDAEAPADAPGQLTPLVADVLENTLIRVDEHVRAAVKGKSDPQVCEGAAALDLLRAAHEALVPERAPLLLEQIDLCMSAVARGVMRSGVPTTTPGLEAVRGFLALALGGGDEGVRREDLSRSFRLMLAPDEGGGRRGGEQEAAGARVGLWCMDASVALLRLGELHSLVVTSGTLSPMQFTAAELGVPFEVRSSSAHVIGPTQVLAAVVPTGPGGTSMTATWKNRSKPEYQGDAGRALLEILRVAPAGVLVFFGSFAFMRSSLEAWKADTGLWSAMTAAKQIFEEPGKSAEAPDVVRRYCAEIDSGGGAALFAVCRGKVSEGVDFADRHARAVVMVGLPFANRGDVKVQCKINYVSSRKAEVGLSGDEWYMHDAMRAVNQAVGRVIRHREDYGAVALLDARFAQKQCVDSLAGWVRSALPPAEGSAPFACFRRRLGAFFRQHLSAARPAAGAAPVPALRASPAAQAAEQQAAAAERAAAEAAALARARAAERAQQRGAARPAPRSAPEAVLGCSAAGAKRRRMDSPPPSPERPHQPPAVPAAAGPAPPSAAAARNPLLRMLVPRDPAPAAPPPAPAAAPAAPAAAPAGAAAAAAPRPAAAPPPAAPSKGGDARAASRALFAALGPAAGREWQCMLGKLAALCREGAGAERWLSGHLTPWLARRLGGTPQGRRLLGEEQLLLVPPSLRGAYSAALRRSLPPAAP
eukprot:TRINITY_DN2354_c2_g1_i1.p1 TRINITY_DN2354_c2_g1~~TRINITY_DN2354_c2_g1_i1.p1  ORF type:complete len:1063 (+),score=363.90 TRINITY_DN2354_c2_g1_i1:73-3189(+)